jgi:glucose-1-phosphate thymidylyltransferase
MKVVIPMAGRGTRLRPHTNVIPKPLLKLCGKSIIEWIVEELTISSDTKIDEIHFIIGDFGLEVENMLFDTAKKVGAKGFIHYQKQALGTAHALYCARTALEGNVFVAFADTIFKGKICIDNNMDGMIWTMPVEDPQRYGVVNIDSNGIITDFIEKPKDFISNLAIVGLYYFKEAEKIRKEIDDLVDNNRKENNEFQLTNCLESLKEKSFRLKNAVLDEWLDCGNKQELLNTNSRLIALMNKGENFVHKSCVIEKSEILGKSSIEKNSHIKNSVIENCIVYEGSHITNCKIKNSIIGNNCVMKGYEGSIFLGDYSEVNYEK